MELQATGAWGPGRIVGGKYTLLGRLAVGGMAEIWLARQAGPAGFNRVVVVKRIIESLSEDPDFVSMFLDEARLGAQLSHPNIVQTLDFGEDAGTWFIVLEYLAGESLAFTVKTAREAGVPFPIDHAVRVISDATLGLTSAHEKTDGTGRSLGIVHRDISPQNLFITYEGGTKVLDFGIAKAAQRATHTNAGQVKGRIAYMAPEHVRGQELDQRADVFSLAVVLYETVTNARLFPGSEPVVVMKQLLSEEPIAPARTLNPEVPPALEAILTVALQKDRDQRFESSMQFRNALETYLRDRPQAHGVPQLAGYMRTLFAKRIADRGHMLERLSTNEPPSKLSPSMLTAMKMEKGSISTGAGARSEAQRDVGEQRTPGSRTRQPASPPSVLSAQRPAQPKSRGLLAVVGVGVLAAAAAGAWLFLGRAKPEPSPVPELAQAEAPQPAPAPPPPAAAAPAAQPQAAAVPAVATTEAAPVAAIAVAPAEAPKRAELARATRERPSRREPERRQAAAEGRLTLDTVPWTQVFLGGKKLGDTPLVDVKVPAGRVELLLVNDSEAIRNVIELDVVEGKTTTKRLRL